MYLGNQRHRSIDHGSLLDEARDELVVWDVELGRPLSAAESGHEHGAVLGARRVEVEDVGLERRVARLLHLLAQGLDVRKAPVEYVALGICELSNEEILRVLNTLSISTTISILCHICICGSTLKGKSICTFSSFIKHPVFTVFPRSKYLGLAQ